LENIQQQQTRQDHQTQHTAIVTGSTSGIGKETALLKIYLLIKCFELFVIDHQICFLTISEFKESTYYKIIF